MSWRRRQQRRTVAEMNATGWMHIYPQSREHGPAEIRGTKEALISLRNALTAAIDGDGTAEATAVTSDGEGYGIDIRRVNVLNLLGPLPYHDNYPGMERHPDWSRPPEPFNPETDRVILYVDAEGAVVTTSDDQ